MRNVVIDRTGAGRRLLADIQRLGLERHIVELEVNGLTVVPPEKTGFTPDFVARLRAAALAIVEKRDGRAPDVEGGTTHANQFLPNYFYVLFEDRIFEELLMSEVGLALITYLLGESAIVSSDTLLVKGPTDPFPTERLQLGLHNDNTSNPGPFQHHAELANLTWLLSDYTMNNGALGYVPGSHLLRRHPLPNEGAEADAVPVEAPMGSLVCWHGNTWHCAFPRKNKGLRIGYPTLFSRPFIVPLQPYDQDVTDEMLARNPPRFRTLMGRHRICGFRSEGPDYTRLSSNPCTTIFS